MDDSVSIPGITVNQRGAARLRGGHLWVYRSDLAPPAEASAGSLVHVRDERGRHLGSALYSSASQIAIRLLTGDEIGEAQLTSLLRERIAAAVRFRAQVARDTDSYRVIFSEADLLPGVILDKYNDVLCLQALTQAFDRQDLRQAVLDAIAEHFPQASIVERVDPHIRELEQLPARQSQLVRGERSSTIFTMNGVRFHFDGLGGQKTGAFLDQRENYAAAAHYAHGDALDDAGPGKVLGDGVKDHLAQFLAVESLGERLQGKHIVVLVEDEPGQQVSLAENHAVGIGVVRDLRAEANCRGNAFAQQSGEFCLADFVAS